MKIGIIRETKDPEDNRVALTPKEILYLQKKYPDTEIVVQQSKIRAYTDQSYQVAGIQVVENVEDCDILFGIKEADIHTLIADKHYFFFGHIAKKQPYNKPLIKKMMELRITFSDYEYLVDDENRRLCAFGWWAGVVGVYNTLRAYGIREKQFELPLPDPSFTSEKLIGELREKVTSGIRIVLTGNGRVSQGAQSILDKMGIPYVSPSVYLQNERPGSRYTVLEIKDLVQLAHENTAEFDRNHFDKFPEQYESVFLKYAKVSDVFISCHFWAPNEPVYLSEADLRVRELPLKVIGDITCDICGSIKSTLRSSTHKNPFYDYNPVTQKEEKAFSSPHNITIMAVDTLPNALALDTSAFFGEMLTKHVFEDILSGRINESIVIQRATILEKGRLTDHFSYLKDYALS